MIQGITAFDTTEHKFWLVWQRWQRMVKLDHVEQNYEYSDWQYGNSILRMHPAEYLAQLESKRQHFIRSAHNSTRGTPSPPRSKQPGEEWKEHLYSTEFIRVEIIWALPITAAQVTNIEEAGYGYNLGEDGKLPESVLVDPDDDDELIVVPEPAGDTWAKSCDKFYLEPEPEPDNSSVMVLP